MTHWMQIQREPYRLFFPLGVLFGLVGTGHWLAYGTGLSESYSGYFHSSLQMWLYMGCFIAGFLMTAVPRFASAPHARPFEILGLLFLKGLIFYGLLTQAWVPAGQAYVAWLILLLLFIVKRFAKKGHSVRPPLEFVWIPIAFVHAICGTIVVLLSQLNTLPAEWMLVGRAMASQGFLLSLVLGIGGFLGPRLMGLHSLQTPEKLRQGVHSNSFRLRGHLLMGALLFASFWMQGPNQAQPAILLRAVVVIFDLAFLSNVLSRPKSPSLFQIFLSASFWLVAIGVWAVVLFPAHHVAMLHILFLGGFSLMTFLVSTMVVISHSGEGEKLGRPLWIWWVIAGGLTGSLALRLWAQFEPERYFIYLGAASAIWMMTGTAWLAFTAPYLLKIPAENAFEKDHDKFKEKGGHAC